MHPKRAANFRHTERFLLVSTVLLVSMLPNAANGAFDVLKSLDASGVRAQLVDLDMQRLGDGIEATHDVYARDIGGFENQLITNGENSIPKQFKYQAALLINTSVGFFQICGAVIISEYHALTAAHCLPYLSGEQNNTYDHFIAVGMLNLSQGLANPGSQIVSVADFLIHMNYGSDKPGYPNDLAILYLDPPIVINDYVQVAEIAHPSMGNFAKTYCVVSGWGLTVDGETTLMQWGYQYIPTPRDCKNFWAISKAARITKRHICGYLYPVQICSGDSGGPLMCGDVVAGIVSWGLANCSGCFPGIYTRVSFHYRWILWAMQQVMKK